jgi:hypothetical protein
VVHVGDLVGDVGELRLERRSRAVDEAAPDVAEPARVRHRAVLEHALARLEAQVQPVVGAVALLELVDYPQRLQVVLEAAVRLHAAVQRILPGVAERRVAEVVRERDRLGQVLVQAQPPGDGARDLRDLDRMREPRAEQVALVVHEDLRLVL